jgi:hypothetical protein
MKAFHAPQEEYESFHPSQEEATTTLSGFLAKDKLLGWPTGLVTQRQHQWEP